MSYRNDTDCSDWLPPSKEVLRPDKKECMAQAQTTRALGASGLIVSPLGVGTNKWIYGKNDERVLQVFQSSLDAGVSFFDTAEVYRFGKSSATLSPLARNSSMIALFHLFGLLTYISSWIQKYVVVKYIL